MSNRAFTLLELLAVLVLVALVSATVVVRWSGLQQGASLEAATAQLQFLDAHLRRYAVSHGSSCELVFDPKQHRVRKLYHDNDNPPWESLGRGILLKSIEPAETVYFQRDGSSNTYGLQLIGPGDLQVWLIVAGITGQVSQLDSEREFRDALQLLQPPE